MPRRKQPDAKLGRPPIGPPLTVRVPEDVRAIIRLIAARELVSEAEVARHYLVEAIRKDHPVPPD